MATVSLTVRVGPCRHYINIEPEISPGLVAFRAPSHCPTCSREVVGFLKIIRADTHEDELVLYDDDDSI